MKSKLYLLATFLLVVVTGCIRNEIPDDTPPPAGERTFTLTASTPGDDAGSIATRLALSETDEGISVKWKEGDVLNLCFVSGTTVKIVKTVSAVAVTNISEDGKTGDFAINIPEGITAPFDLYGVYGAGFTAEHSTEIQFPAPPTGASLENMEPVCVLRFAKTGITGSDPVSVSFSHLGAILGISLVNASEDDYDITSLSLSNTSNWFFNAMGQATCDITTGEFTDNKAGDALVFPAIMDISVPAGESVKLYHWFVPLLPSVPAAPTVTLNGTAMAQALPAKTFTVGKYYRLMLAWDGTEWKYARMPSATYLVGHWPFDGNANDALGENHGNVNGATLATDRFDNANGAYSFNRSNRDNIYVTNSAIAVFGVESFSCNVWVNTTALGLGNIVRSDNCYNTSGWFVRFNDGKIQIWEGRYASISYESSGTYNDGKWHMVTYVRDIGQMKGILYVDGVFVGNYTITTINNLVETKIPLYFGSCATCCEYYSGKIDDIRIYNKALSAEEVRALYYYE